MKKYVIFKIIIVMLFLYISFEVTTSINYYIRTTVYADDITRVILDDKEITKKVSGDVFVTDNTIFMSFDSIQNYLNEDIFFDKKYNTVIICDEENIMKLPIGNDKYLLNNIETEYKEHIAFFSGDNIYLPMKELEDILDINIHYDDKVVITTENVEYYTLDVKQKIKVKLYKREKSLTLETVDIGDKVYVYDCGSESYAKVRTHNGEIGYVLKVNLVGEKQEFYATEKNVNDNKIINLVWDYIEVAAQDRSNEKKIDALDVVSPTWFQLKNGSGDFTSIIDKNYINWAKKVGYEIWPTIKNDQVSMDVTSKLVNDMYSRENFIDSIIKIVKQYNFPGINIDFENMYKDDKNYYSEFIREFSATCRKNNIIISVDVTVPDGSDTWSLCFDRKAIGKASDYVVLMAYDQYGITKEGPVASVTWVENNIKKMLDVKKENIDSSKLILGIPFYSKYRKDKINKSGDEEYLENITTSSFYMDSAKKYLNSTVYKKNSAWDEKLRPICYFI